MASLTEASSKPSFSGNLFVAVLVACALFWPCHSMADPLFSSSGQSNTLALRSFTVETKPDQHVLVECGICVNDSHTIQALLRDGAIINLTCRLVIERLRKVLANETLADRSEVHQLRYDPLTRDFIMLRPNAPARRNKKLDALLAATWECLAFNMPLENPLLSGETYRVRLDVTLQHAEVPPWLEKALFFWSWDVAPASSFTQEFTY